MTIWVSPNGNDSQSGTQSFPLKTLEGARNRIRYIHSNFPQTEDFIVYLMDGDFRMEKPLVLEPQDSGQNGFQVIWKAAEGASPRVLGSIPVTGWTLHDAQLNIYRASVPAGMRSRQFYVNGQRAVRCRTSDWPEGFVPAWKNPGKAPDQGNGGIQFEVSGYNDTRWKNPFQWTKVNRIEAVLQTQWRMLSVVLQDLVPEGADSGLITVQDPGWTNSNIFLDPNLKVPGIWSFWRITRFENAYQFLTDPGEWYLDEDAGVIYYIPLPSDPSTIRNAELPVLDTLIEFAGNIQNPVTNVRFEGITFAYATWRDPSGPGGYIADQSGCLVVGNHAPNVGGHVKHAVTTPGNITLEYAHNTEIVSNSFEHLGAAAISYGDGCIGNLLDRNEFDDISSSAVFLGNVKVSGVPVPAADYVMRNTISNNIIQNTGVEFVDTAGIFVGFTQQTLVTGNTISNVPWTGIATGWGWGLLDPDGYPGLPGMERFGWGTQNYHIVNKNNVISHNTIDSFLNVLWDGGAIYTTGYQGTSMLDALVIEGNIAVNKNEKTGGNVYYLDGGTRWVKMKGNVSLNNKIGYPDFGPTPKDIGIYLRYSEYWQLGIEEITKFLIDKLPYGGQTGGCRTYGDIDFTDNVGIGTEFYVNLLCIFIMDWVSYPVRITFTNNMDAAQTNSPHP